MQREAALFQDPALVDAALDEVPGHAMLALAVQQRPDRGVDPGVARQRAVVEVYRRLRRQSQQRVGDDPQVGDTEKPVERRSGEAVLDPGRQAVHRDPVGGRPDAHIGIGADDRRDRAAAFQQLVSAAAEQRFVPDQNGGKSTVVKALQHHLCPPGACCAGPAAGLRNRTRRGAMARIAARRS